MSLERQAALDRRFIRLTFGAAFVTLLMIVIGAITRVTESGLGCGPYWPSCNGLIIPEFHDMTVVIEFGHRLFALVVGGFAFGVAWMAHKHYRQIGYIFVPSILALVLFFVQSGLGAVTVALYQYAPNVQWMSVAIHLGNSMFLLAAFLVTWVNARRILSEQPAETPVQASGASGSGAAIVLPPTEVMLATALSFIVAMVGAAVAGTNATKACVGWPLCDGEIWPTTQGPLQQLNMLHRLVAGGLGLMLILMLFQSRGVQRSVRTALFGALHSYLLQAALGATVVLIDNREWLVVSRSLHVLFAATTWAALVIASATAWLQLLPDRLKSQQVRQVAAPSATTSS